jgi:hypothetical protein
MTTTTTAPTTQATPDAIVAAPVRTLGIVSLSLGVASLIFGANPVLGIAALVVGILGLRNEPAGKNFSIAGIVTGAVSLVGLAFGTLAFFAFLPFTAFFIPALF